MVKYYKNTRLENLPYINEEGLTCWEEFKDICGYEGSYQVSDLGRVKSLKSNIILSIQLDRYGYTYVSFSGKKYKVHQLVAKTFLPNPENKPTVNHKDEIKTNNKVNNLEWFTVEEQNKYSRGIDIKLFHNNSIKTYSSVLEASNDLGIDSSSVITLSKEYMKLMDMCKNILSNNLYIYKDFNEVKNISECKGIILKNDKFNVRVTINSGKRVHVGDFTSFEEAVEKRNAFIITNSINQPIYNIKESNDILKDNVFSNLLLLQQYINKIDDSTLNKILEDLIVNLKDYVKLNLD